MKIKTKMKQNLAEIISINYYKSISIILGKCANSENCDGKKNILFQCGGCKKLICSSCTNGNSSECVLCKTNNFENLEIKCIKCRRKYNYLMCFYCSKILKLCSTGCVNSENEAYIKDDFYGDNNMWSCGDC